MLFIFIASALLFKNFATREDGRPLYDIKTIKSAMNQKNPSNEDLPYWKDIYTVAVNRENPRTTFCSFNDKDSAKAATKFVEGSPNYYNLNGKWKFYYVDYPKDLPTDVTDKDVDESKWKDINVPGNWEFQGDNGVAMYTNVHYDFNPRTITPPYLPDMVPVGVYRRHITIPQEWISGDRLIYLQVGAYKTGLYVYVNGVEVGYAEDSKDPADFLLNKYLDLTKNGENIITLKIYKYSSGSYLDDMDMWRFGGIERDVYLYSQPKLHIQDYVVVSSLDDTYSDGIYKLNVTILNQEDGSADKIRNFQVDYEVYDIKDLTKTVLSGTQKESIDPSVNKKLKKTVVFETQTLKSCKIWSDEFPNLYKLVITLKDSDNNDKVLESFPSRIGFRRTDIKKIKFNGKDYNAFYFNGKQYKIKGTNIHEHDERTGHYVQEATMRKDIELLKKNNFNAIRLSHYPNGRLIYELCDELGIFVLSECNIETHAMGMDLRKGGTLANNPAWLKSHMDRSINMWNRLKNFACINFISLGNEAGNGYNFYMTYSYIKHYEERAMNRSIAYEYAYYEWNTDLRTPMYMTADWLRDQGEHPTDRPILMYEYNHAMGNSNGNFDRMWDQIYKYPNLVGGFIWDWVDQGMLETSKKTTLKDNKEEERKYWAYGGDYGVDAPSDGNFNINGLVSPNRTEHPCLVEIKHTQQNIGFKATNLYDNEKKNAVIVIRNRFYQQYLSDYEITYSVCANEKILRTRNIDSEVSDLSPQSEKTIYINLDDLVPEIATEYFLNFSVKLKFDYPDLEMYKGFEIAQEQFQLPIEKLPKKKADGTTGPELIKDDSESKVVISSDRVYFEFSKTEGIVKSFKINSEEYISDSGFQPNFWRAPTDNDYGNGMPQRQQIWKTMSHNFKPVGYTYDGSDFVNHKYYNFKVTYEIVGQRTFSITYKIYSTGVMKVSNEFDGTICSDKQEDIPRLGLRFRILPEYKNVEYFGRGPKENYWDRHFAYQVSRYESTADDLYFPYVRPQENGHHTETRWLAFENGEENGKGLLIVANDYSFVEFNALRNTVEDFDDEDQTHLPRQWDNFDDCFHIGGKCNHDEEWAKNKLRRQHHIDDIVMKDFVEVNIDYKMMGLAGYDSWGDRPLPEFTLPSDKKYQFGFTIVPINNKNEIDEIIQFEYD